MQNGWVDDKNRLLGMTALMGLALFFHYAAVYGCLTLWMGCFGWYLYRHPIRLRPSVWTVLIGLYLLLTFAAFLRSDSLLRGWHSWLDLWPLVLVLFRPESSLCDREERDRLFRLLFGVLCFYLVLVIISIGISCVHLHLYPWQWPLLSKQFLADCPPYEWCFWLFAPHKHPTFHCLVAASLLLAGASVSRAALVPARLFWPVALGWCIVPLFSQSRVGLLIWFFTLVMAFLIRLQHRRMKILLTIAVVLLTIGCIVWNWSWFSADPLRAYLYEQARTYIEAHPWWGAGLGVTWPEVAASNGAAWTGSQAWFFPDPALYSAWSMPVFQPHNQWLTDWMRGGLFLVLSWTMIVLGWFYEAFRRRDYFLFSTGVLLVLVAGVDSPAMVARGVCWMVWTIFIGSICRQR